MLLRLFQWSNKSTTCFNCRLLSYSRRLFSQELDKSYTDDQKEKILEVMNQFDSKDLSRYDVTKSRVKKITQWKDTYGRLKTIGEIELIDGFADKFARKLFDSILKGPETKVEVKKVNNKIKGQVLHPSLSETVRQKCKSILTLYVSVNLICWALVDRDNYEVVIWDYYGIDYPDSKKLQITDIMYIAWKVMHKIPYADLYVMKAEATTLRASGSDPNNPKVMAINLQKSQMIAMIVALINARSNPLEDSKEDEYDNNDQEMFFKHKVYFLRPTLPYRLYGTLVGNERVSTDQTIEALLQNIERNPERKEGEQEPYISGDVISKFRSQNELQRDMLGHCLLLALTFMDICIFKKQESINKLVKRGE